MIKWLIRSILYPTATVIIRFHFSVPNTCKRLFKIPTEHFNPHKWKFIICGGTKSKKLLNEGFRITLTFTDSLTQTCWLLFGVAYLVCFELTAVMPVSRVGICADNLLFGRMSYFCMSVGNGDAMSHCN